MPICFLGLGSNLGDCQKQIHNAVQDLQADPKISDLICSSLYQTPAIGPPQDDFINAVVKCNSAYSAEELLERCLRIEKKQGRIRLKSERWGPRSIDIDVLLYEQVQRQEENYTLPHPRLKERLFVLLPLYEIEPNLILPCQTALKDLIQNFSEDERATIRKKIF